MNNNAAPGLSYLTINALIWAAIILLGSYFYKQAPRYDLFLGIAVISYSISNALIYKYMKQQGLFDKEDYETDSQS